MRNSKVNPSRLIRLAALSMCAITVACSGQQGDAPAANSGSEQTAAGASTEAESGAAAAEPEAPMPGFESGQSWSLVTANAPALDGKAVEAGVFIEVQDERLVGYSGCNRFSASMQQGKDGSLSVDVPVASKRACADPELNAAEQAFLQALPRLRRAEVKAERLLLSGDDGLLLEFTPGRPGEAEMPSE